MPNTERFERRQSQLGRPESSYRIYERAVCLYGFTLEVSGHRTFVYPLREDASGPLFPKKPYIIQDRPLFDYRTPARD